MTPRIEQLLQLFSHTTWDGDLISKYERSKLVEAGLADRAHGYNFITAKGIRYLLDLGLIRPGHVYEIEPLPETQETSA